MSLDAETLAQFLDMLDRFVKERLIPNEARIADEDAILARTGAGNPRHGPVRPVDPRGIRRPRPDHGRRGAGGLRCWARPRRPSARWSAPTTASARRASSSTARPNRRPHYLPRLATGEMIASFALTEPEAGSDAASLAHQRAARGWRPLHPERHQALHHQRAAAPACSRYLPAPTRPQRLRRRVGLSRRGGNARLSLGKPLTARWASRARTPAT